jgi:hypothetical protein
MLRKPLPTLSTSCSNWPVWREWARDFAQSLLPHRVRAGLFRPKVRPPPTLALSRIVSKLWLSIANHKPVPQCPKRNRLRLPKSRLFVSTSAPRICAAPATDLTPADVADMKDADGWRTPDGDWWHAAGTTGVSVALLFSLIFVPDQRRQSDAGTARPQRGKTPQLRGAILMRASTNLTTAVGETTR